MPIFRDINRDFFKIWTPEMAYILGFFAADGNMIKTKRGGYYIEFTNSDLNILRKVRKILGSNHKISARDRGGNWIKVYRIQIGSKVIFKNLLSLGLTPSKSLSIKFPDVPRKFMGDFVRGYFDGDGGVYVHKYLKSGHKTKSWIILAHFTSGSEAFIKSLKDVLIKSSSVVGGNIQSKGGAHRLRFSTHDSKGLYNFMYSDLKNQLFMTRKKREFEKFFNIAGVA